MAALNCTKIELHVKCAIDHTEILFKCYLNLVYTYLAKRAEYMVYVNSDQKLMRNKSFSCVNLHLVYVL